MCWPIHVFDGALVCPIIPENANRENGFRVSARYTGTLRVVRNVECMRHCKTVQRARHQRRMGHARHGGRAACARGAIGGRRAARRRQRDRGDGRRRGDDRRRLSAHEFDRRRCVLADSRAGRDAARHRRVRRGRRCRRRLAFYRDHGLDSDTVSRRHRGEYRRRHGVGMGACARAQQARRLAGAFRSRACSPMRSTMRGTASR